MTSRRNFLLVPAATLLCGRRPPAGNFQPEPLPATRLVFGGDVMLSRYVGRLARTQRDPAWPFQALAAYLAGADIAFLNLESPFSDRGRPVEKGMVFKTEPEMVEGLLTAGVDVVSTANNHSRDCGAYGLEFTLRWLACHGIASAGTGRTEEESRSGAVIERNGVRFGFLAYTYDQSNGNHPKPDLRVAMLDAERLGEDVAGMKARADVVIVSMHAGDEYRPKPNEQQVRFAHAAVDAGARLVIGHHPHVVQPVEKYGEGVIFYSLGNLVFDQFHRQETQRGLLAEVTFRGSWLERVELRNVDILRTAPQLSGLPSVFLERAIGPAGG